MSPTRPPTPSPSAPPRRDGDHRADDREQRQPARRGHGRRPDPRGQSHRTKQFGLDLGDYTINAVFSPKRDPRGTTATATRPTASHQLAAVQRQHHHARHQHRPTSTWPCRPPWFASSRATRETKLIAKPQLRGAEGAEADAEPRRGNAGSHDHVHAGGRGRRELQPADVVHLPPGRRQREITPRVTLRGRHLAGAASSRTARSARGSTSPGRSCRRSPRARS